MISSSLYDFLHTGSDLEATLDSSLEDETVDLFDNDKNGKFHVAEIFLEYRQTGWIGTVEVNRDTGLEPGETQIQNVSPGSNPAS